MRIFNFLVALAVLITVASCRSAYVSATISNRTSESLSLLEVDYPSASFGTQTLEPGKDFHYRFKVLGTGPTAVLWTSSPNHEQKNTGPTLKEGDEGQLIITFIPGSSPTWNLQLLNRPPLS